MPSSLWGGKKKKKNVVAKEFCFFSPVRVLCEVPQANYHKLLYFGSEEPSSCSATEHLQQLLSHQAAK